MENKLISFIEKYMPLSEEEKEVINEIAIFKKYKKGEIILKEGIRSRENYFVIHGCVRTYYIIAGEENTTAFYTEFESVAHQTVGAKEPSNYNLACVEDSVLAVFNPAMEKNILQKFPRFETLRRILSEELLAKNQAYFDIFRTSTPEKRYLEILDKRPDLIQRIPQYQLASYLGIKPESLSRIRKRLYIKNKKRRLAFL